LKPDKSWTFHPFLYAIFPSLFLYSRNLDWVRPPDLLKPVVVTVLLTGIVLAFARAVLRSGTKAGVLASAFLIVVFSYGHVMRLVQGFAVGGLVVGRTMILFPGLCVALAGLTIVLARTRKDLRGITGYLSVLGVILVVTSLGQIGVGCARAGRGSVERWIGYVDKSCSGRGALPVKPGMRKPDIYYIILDNYSRADILKREFGYDNSEFIRFVRSKGFYVADRSECNHLGTLGSLPSSLNFDYLATLTREAGIKTLNTQVDLAMIRKSKLVALLRAAGYKLVTFPSGYAVTADVGADVVCKRSIWSMNEFDRVLLNTTMLAAMLAVLPQKVFSSVGEMESYRSDIRHTLDKLVDTPRIKGPKFAFAHLTVTHPPFVFDADGNVPRVRVDELTTTDQLKSHDPKLYTDSITYVNREMTKVVEEILSRSENPPVIILQADHGVSHYVTGKGLLDGVKRHAIFNAYYLPGGGTKALYPSISPVNSFRVVMNAYLGAHFPLLKDVQDDAVAGSR
jgi:hypothetical protein